jgi:two-component system sensor histidine kinase ChvG
VHIRSGKSSQKRLISPLSARILAIMLLPLILLLIGLFSVDKYGRVLIAAELDALQRQGEMLARSLALAEADRTPLAQRRLSDQTLRHLLPLVGYGSVLRARVFQPDGRLMADTARDQMVASSVRLRRRGQMDMEDRLKIIIANRLSGLSQFLSREGPVPNFRDGRLRHVSELPVLGLALRGESRRAVWRNGRGQLVLAVSLPIQDLRVVRGALLMTTSGGRIEAEIREVQWNFIQVLFAVLLVTIVLALYLARSITRPIGQLASAASQVRANVGSAEPLAKLPQRSDEIGDLSTALLQMTEELQARMAATAGFAADVAHELKNPLTSLRSAVETVARLEDPAQQRKLMDVILADVQRLDRLISDISFASRVDAEMARTDTELQDFGQLAESWVTMARDRHGSWQLDWTAPQEEMPVQIHASRIVQILDNLLANAISFSPSGAPLSIGLEADQGRLIFALCDRGPGIPAGKLETIFDRFYSERPSDEAFGTHSGLGLSIARQIAEAHGGSLTASNRKNGGACFTLSLPLATAGRRRAPGKPQGKASDMTSS